MVTRSWMRESAGSDEGVTLSEFLVVLVLLAVVLATAYGAAQALRRGANATDRDSELARQVTYPMLQLEKLLIQNRSLDTAGPYDIVFLTDRDMDGKYERHSISATASGTITLNSETLDTQGYPVATTLVRTIASRNSNRAAGVPMFRYFNRQRIEVTSTVTIPMLAESMLLTVVSTKDGRSITDSRTINFRNRD